jgi:DNA-binding FrmR family transcriptional regulator
MDHTHGHGAGTHKLDMLARLKSAEGHLRGIQRMVEEDVYCVDIIKQTLAVQRAIDKVNALILENHLNTCVTTAIRNEDEKERERVISEIVDVFQATSKF